MALNLVSGMGITDPRVDGMRTFAGSAISTFLKIRTDMNLAVWKMRLKLSDPTDLIKLEMEIEERIFNLRKDQAEMASKTGAEKVKLFKEMRAARKDRYETNMKARVDLITSYADLSKEAAVKKEEYDTTELPPDVKNTVDQKIDGLIGKEVNEFVVTMAAMQAAPEGASKDALIQEAATSRALIQEAMRVFGTGAVAKSGQSGIATAVNPKNAQKKSWMYLYEEPVRRILGEIKKEEVLKAKAAKNKDDAGFQKSLLKIQYLEQAAAAMIQGANEAKYGKGNPENRDIRDEYIDQMTEEERRVARAAGLLESAIPGVNSGMQKLPSDEELMKQVSAALDTSDMDARFDTEVERLTTRLKGVGDRRFAREQTRDELLSFEGRNMALSPFSTYSSDVGQTMIGMSRRGETEQNLRDVSGAAGGNFPTGTGGSLTNLIKKRISFYVDAMDNANGDLEQADFSGATENMEDILSAVDLFRGSLTQADVTFVRPVRDYSNDSDTLSLTGLLDGYRKRLPNIPNEDKNKFAAATMDSIKAGDAPIAAEYLSMQRSGSPEEQMAAAYNQIYYPMKTNVSVAIQPQIESMIAARKSNDIQGMAESIQAIGQSLSNPSLDDLFGSAGQNMLMAIGDMPNVASELGEENALLNTSDHIEKQYNDLMQQRVEEDNAAQEALVAYEGTLNE